MNRHQVNILRPVESDSQYWGCVVQNGTRQGRISRKGAGTTIHIANVDYPQAVLGGVQLSSQCTGNGIQVLQRDFDSILFKSNISNTVDC